MPPPVYLVELYCLTESVRIQGALEYVEQRWSQLISRRVNLAGSCPVIEIDRVDKIREERPIPWRCRARWKDKNLEVPSLSGEDSWRLKATARSQRYLEMLWITSTAFQAFFSCWYILVQCPVDFDRQKTIAMEPACPAWFPRWHVYASSRLPWVRIILFTLGNLHPSQENSMPWHAQELWGSSRATWTPCLVHWDVPSAKIEVKMTRRRGLDAPFSAEVVRKASKQAAKKSRSLHIYPDCRQSWIHRLMLTIDAGDRQLFLYGESYRVLQ